MNFVRGTSPIVFSRVLQPPALAVCTAGMAPGRNKPVSGSTKSRHQALVNLCGCTQLHLVCVDILLLQAGRSLDIIPSFLGGHHDGGEILVIWDGSFHHFWR